MSNSMFCMLSCFNLKEDENIDEFRACLDLFSLKLIEDDGPMCRNSFKRKITEKPYYCYQTKLAYNFYETLDPIGTGVERIQNREPSSRRIQG